MTNATTATTTRAGTSRLRDGDARGLHQVDGLGLGVLDLADAGVHGRA